MKLTQRTVTIELDELLGWQHHTVIHEEEHVFHARPVVALPTATRATHALRFLRSR